MASSNSRLDVASLFRVDGMVAVITGGGTGIGLIMARALAANGAKRVYLLGRRLEVLAAAAKEHPSIFVPLQCDVTSKDSLQSAVDHVAAESGYINLLVANAGVPGPLDRWDPALPIWTLRDQLFDAGFMAAMSHTLQVNVTGAFFTLVAFLELLNGGNRRALREGTFGAPIDSGSDVLAIQSQVIFTGSISAFSRVRLSPPAYSASKAALLHLTKHTSSNLASYGIRANALAPGLFPSELAQSLIANRDPGKEDSEDPRFIPARRFGGDEEMAGTILYLAGRAGSYCNGTVLLNDGGRLGMMPSSY